MQGDPHTAGAGKEPLGLGEDCAPMGTRDVRLLALALQQMWPMDPAAKEAAVRRLEAVVMNPETKPRAFDHALKALISVGRLNLQAIGVGLNARAQEELAERVANLERNL